MKHFQSVRSLVALSFLLAAAAISAESMWTVQEIAEIDGYSELDDIVALKFKDAVSGQVIQGLKVQLGGAELEGADGIVEFPLSVIEDITDQDVPFVATAPGYLPLKDSLRIRVGTVISKRFLMTKGMEINQARFVLEWDRSPSDLDAHLVGPGFHVSYREMKDASGKARLDRDARSGFGPETITLLDIQRGAEYAYSVDNFSGEAPMKNVKVSVYLNNALDRVVFIPRATARTISILKITGDGIQYLAQ